ncbi:adaptin ear-binding coat-associated protein 2-like isoform X2 [Porites lutea]|uniref:adaptin ear-binding coat-associated protein 2-like isoform X2 n=1 Tax=Porites lutea TaxID=51062 RepID=UPI003CC557B0
MEDYESVLCVKNECFIYKIPPRTSNRGYRAADWKLDQPDWTGRVRVCAKGKECYIKIEDKSSGQHAFIGMGFQDRGDSFDFNVALQDHFKWIKQSEKLEAEASQPDPGPKLDLSFKEGQTIHINLGKRSPGSSATNRPKPAGGGLGIIPPPPGGVAPKIAPPPGSGASPAAGRRAVQPHTQAPFPSMDNFGASSTVQQQSQQQKTMPDWGDFTSASGSSDSSWVQF